jgi:hypothetical protein
MQQPPHFKLHPPPRLQWAAMGLPYESLVPGCSPDPTLPHPAPPRTTPHHTTQTSDGWQPDKLNRIPAADLAVECPQTADAW